MKPFKNALIVILLASVGLLAAPARAAAPGSCTTGALPSGALSLICVPLAGWNGSLVVFAHDYVGFDQQFISIPALRYGHCNFDTAEVVTAFLTLLAQP